MSRDKPGIVVFVSCSVAERACAYKAAARAHIEHIGQR